MTVLDYFFFCCDKTPQQGNLEKSLFAVYSLRLLESMTIMMKEQQQAGRHGAGLGA